MVGAVLSKTANYGFNRIRFDMPGWHGLEHDNWTLADALLASIGSIPGSRGIWTNGTPYVVGDRVADPDGGGLYRCAVAHTSGVSGTFADDRAAHPSYWTLITQVPIWVGIWATATSYNPQDIVRQANAYYYCIVAHTSGVFATDLAAGRWTLVFDLQDAYDQAAAAAASASAAADSASAASGSASAAAGSASAASGSASAAGTSASNAAISAGNASSSASTAAGHASAAGTSAANASNSASAAATSASNASTSESNAATSATNASNSAAAAAASANNTVKVTAQAFSGAQQDQALSNLGANSNGITILKTATSIGAALGTAANADAGRSAINAGPISNTVGSSVIGYIIGINTAAGNGFVIPAGGTWEYQAALWSSPGGVYGGTNYVGTAAGGSTIPGTSGYVLVGRAKRIA